MRRAIAIVGFAALSLALPLGVARSQEKKAEEPKFAAFKKDAFLDFSFDSADARVEDVKVAQDDQGRVSATVNIKNKSGERQLRIAVAMALYDEKKTLLAAGNEQDFLGGSGLDPRFSGPWTIQLGHLADLDQAKLYQVTVHYRLEDKQ
jgi:hypothetical protein